jgi:transcription-repair coupling factor (superfamily II helicase)
MHSCNIIIFIALIAGFDGASGWILDSRVRIWSAFREIPLLPRNAACYSHPVIAMDRQITPGDYVVHPSYGVGQFTGTLSYSSGTNGVHGSMLSVHYKDGELLVKDDDAKKSLFFVQANSMCHVHSLLDARTWRKKSANLDKSVEK